MLLPISSVEIALSSSLKRSKNMQNFIRVNLFGSAIDHFLRSDCRIGHTLAPAHNLFVDLSVPREAYLGKHGVVAKTDRIRNLASFDTLFTEYLQQRYEFISVSR